MTATFPAGIYSAEQIPMDAYLADPAPEPSLSGSIVKLLVNRTPAHAWYAHPRLNKAWEPSTNDAFDLGTACHDVLLGDGSTVKVFDYKDWRTNEAKAARDAARAAGKVPLLRHRYEQVEPVVDVARAGVDRIGRILFGLPRAEHTIIWADEDDDGETWMRCRPDLHDDAAIIHYKTTDTNAGSFDRQFCNMGYDITAAWYERGCGGRQIFLVQEMTPPYLCVAYEPSEGMMAMARRKVDYAIALWRKCMAANTWPGYPTAIQTITSPSWADAEWLGFEETGRDLPEAIDAYIEAFKP